MGTTGHESGQGQQFGLRLPTQGRCVEGRHRLLDEPLDGRLHRRSGARPYEEILQGGHLVLAQVRLSEALP